MSTRRKLVEVKTTTSLMSLLSLIEQRKSKRDQELKAKKEAQGSVPTNCIFDIIVRLPLESICTSRFVSKSWYEIIRSSHFRNTHLQRCDTGIIFLTPNTKSISTASRVSVESKAMSHDWPIFDQPPSFNIMFMEIKGGTSTIKDYNTTCTGSIKATCNGLIVLEYHLRIGKGLLIINPVTRELEKISFGIVSSLYEETYGLGFCHVTKKYKLVHWFNNVYCEIMEIGSGSWSLVGGPRDVDLKSPPRSSVSVMGALHWLPKPCGNEYIVTMTLDDEKFKKIALPRVHKYNNWNLEMDDEFPLPRFDENWILEMREFLGFLSSSEMEKRMDVWMLKDLGGRWEKQYSIDLSGTGSLHPLYCRRVNGELVFRGGRHDNVHAYSQYGVMRKIGVMIRDLPGRYFPHVNSLVSWRS